MTLLILGTTVITGAGVCGLVDLGEVEGEVGGEVGVRVVDAAVDDCDANALAHGGIPGPVRGAAGDVISVASDLLDSPSLGSGGVVGVVGGRCLRRWRRGGNWKGGGSGRDGTVSWEAADGGGRQERLHSAVYVRGDWQRPESKTECGDDPVVKNITYVGLGREETEGGCVVLSGGGLNGCNAEVFVGLCETGPGGAQAGLGVAGNGGVAIDDQVAMGSDAGGVNLRHGSVGQERKKEIRQGRDLSRPEEGASRFGMGRWRSDLGEYGHGGTSFVSLRYESAPQEFALVPVQLCAITLVCRQREI